MEMEILRAIGNLALGFISGCFFMGYLMVYLFERKLKKIMGEKKYNQMMQIKG